MRDVISRQKAIEALIEWYGCKPDDIEAFEEIIKAMPPAQPEQRWIPCSERLPEEWRDVLLSFDKSITERTNVGYMFRDEETFEYWFQSDGMSYKKDDVLAWMPLPDAYEEDD